MPDRFDYTQIPEPSMGALRLYIDKRAKPGDFLTAVLENDLRGSMREMRARHRRGAVCESKRGK